MDRLILRHIVDLLRRLEKGTQLSPADKHAFSRDLEAVERLVEHVVGKA